MSLIEINTVKRALGVCKLFDANNKRDFRRMIDNTPEGILPNLIIIGAQKCGTTSLHYYLSLHPQIYMSKEKELDFFVFSSRWKKGVEWYKSHFVGEATIYGETSPNYTNYPLWKAVPKRMYSLVPNTKLIYILRDPVERIVSEYAHQYSNGIEDKPILQVLSNFETNRYVQRSKYFMQLEQYLNYFPLHNILITTLEDLNREPQATLKNIFSFLSVDDTFDCAKSSVIKHKTSQKRRKNSVGKFLQQTPLAKKIDQLPFSVREKAKALLYLPFSEKVDKPILDKNLHEELVNYLAPDINCLRQLTGYSFESWSI